MEDQEKFINDTMKKLLELMGVDATFQVKYDKEDEAFVVNIESENEVGLLIGTRGETLNALQTFLGMAMRSQTETWQRVIVNVGDWREKQTEKLVDLAKSAAARAKETGEDQPLYNLSAFDRRIVHMTLVDDKEVDTESYGEGEDRYLIIKLSKNSS